MFGSSNNSNTSNNSKHSKNGRSLSKNSKNSKNSKSVAYWESLVEKDVFVFNEADKATFYAWIHPEMFEYLNTPAGEPLLQKWLEGLDFDPDALKKGLFFL